MRTFAGMNRRRYLQDRAPGGFSATGSSGWSILARDDLVHWASMLARGELPALRSLAGGRAAHPVVALPGGGEAVLRRYLRGGLMRHLNRDRYFLGHRAFEELQITARARAAGVRVAEPLAALERRAAPGPGYQAMLATRLLDGVEGLDGVMARGGAEREVALRVAGEEISRMHRAGIAHPDLNLRNLLVRMGDAGGRGAEVHLIDFDRARLLGAAVPARERRAEILRLARSAKKLGVALEPTDLESLRTGYGADWPLSADSRG